MTLGQGTGRLQSTLDDLKRRLRQEREESETLTTHLTLQREQNRVAEDSRFKKLELDLMVAQRQVAEQKEAAESLRQQLARLHAESRARMRTLEQELAQAEDHLREERALAETRALERDEALLQAQHSPASALQDELAGVRAQLEQQKQASEAEAQRMESERVQNQWRITELEARTRGLEEEIASARAATQSCQITIEQLTAERDESRAQVNELEAQFRALEEEFASAQGQFREQREAAVEVIRQLEQERDGDRARLSEREARTQWLEEELGSARDKLRSVPVTLMVLSTDLLASQFQADPAMVEAVRDIQLQSKRLLEEIQTPQQSPPPQAPQPENGF